MLDVKSIIVRNKEILASDMDGEVVMMHIESGKYYNLGKIGGIIWNMLEEPLAVEGLIDQLLDLFQVGKEQCVSDTLPFLQQMEQQGLIKVLQ